MADTSEFDDDGRIVSRGILQTRLIPDHLPGKGPLVPRRGSVTVVEGGYLRLADGTVAGPMQRKDAKGDVYCYRGARHIVPTPDDDESLATALGTVWLDENGNAHSDPSPLDAKEVFTGIVFW